MKSAGTLWYVLGAEVAQVVVAGGEGAVTAVNTANTWFRPLVVLWLWSLLASAPWHYDGISLCFTTLAAGERAADEIFFPLLLSWSKTFIFHLCFGAMAVKFDKIVITVSNRRYTSSNFIFQVLYLGIPKYFIITRGALI